jgi:hypothetical protein
LLAAATLIGGAAVVLPRVVVSPPSAPVDPYNPGSIAFEVTNTGIIPLSDVSASVALGRISAYGGRIEVKGSDTFGARFTNAEWQHHKLAMDERFTVTPEYDWKEVDSFDVAIVVTYMPWFVPVRQEKAFRFVGVRGIDRLVRWKSWPLGDSRPQ